MPKLCDIIEQLDNLTEMQATMILRTLAPDDAEPLETPGILLLLIADYLIACGSTLDNVLQMVWGPVSQILDFGKYMARKLDAANVVPMGFLMIVDNRYTVFTGHGDPRLWDSKEKVFVTQPGHYPVFSTTVNVSALYLGTVARFAGHATAAEAFEAGQLTPANGCEHTDECPESS